MEELVKLARNGKFEELERKWMEALGPELGDWRGFLEVAESLVRRKRSDLAESLLWYLLTEQKERRSSAEGFQTALRACDLLPDSDVIRDEAAELYLKAHGESDGADVLVNLTLADRSVPLDVAMKRLQALRRLTPGTYVRSDPGARFGRVVGVNAEGGTLTVAFEDGEQEHDPSAVERLVVAPEEDFRALSLFERPRMEALAEQDPEELISLALRTFGGRLELGRLRLYVEPLLGSTTWSRWWSRVKRAAAHSHHIAVTSGTHPNVFLRARPVSRQERLQEAFAAAGAQEKLRLALEALAESPRDQEAQSALLESFAGDVAALASGAADATPAESLGALAVLDLLEERLPALKLPGRPDVHERIEKLDLITAVCEGLGEEEVIQAVFDAFRRWLPDRWGQLYAQLMPHLARNPCEFAAGQLARAGDWDSLREGVRGVLERPDTRPGALVWLWKACVSGGWERAVGDLDRTVVLRRLLATAASLARGDARPETQRKQQRSQIQQALLIDDGATLREVLEGTDDASVRGILGLVERNPGLTVRAEAALARTIRLARAHLFKKETPPWEEPVVYATAQGIQKQREALDHILHVRLPRVIKEIGEAAKLGDLSENAEYSAAITERGRLAELATSMRDQLLRARLISPAMAAAPYVNIGTRVRARNLESGEVESFTFLGPWAADPAAGVYSYAAPLGLAFMGSRVGGQVSFRNEGGERRWEVLEVSPAVEE